MTFILRQHSSLEVQEKKNWERISGCCNITLNHVEKKERLVYNKHLVVVFHYFLVTRL